MAEHTPLPWHVAYLDKNAQRVVKAEHIEISTCWHHSVGSIEKEMEANAALIVRAVNSHDALVEALEWYAKDYDFGRRVSQWDGGAKARAALALSEQHEKTGGDQ